MRDFVSADYAITASSPCLPDVPYNQVRVRDVQMDMSKLSQRALVLSAILALAAVVLPDVTALSAQPVTVPTLVIRGIDVLPMDRDTVLRNHDVVIAGRRIVSIGPARTTYQRGVTTIDGHGQFLIPGLWDVHVHALDLPPETRQLLLRHGVTSMRDMGSRSDSLPARRRALNDGTLDTPGLWAVGPLLDGPRQRWSHAIAWHLTRPEDAAPAIDSLVRLGVDFVKVYNTLSRDTYLALVEAAGRRNLPVVGHIPFAVTAAEAARAGQRSLEHAGPEVSTLDCVDKGHARFSALLGTWGAQGYGAYLAGLDTLYRTRDAACVRNLMALYHAQGTFVVPTIVNAIKDSATIDRPALALLDAMGQQGCEATIAAFHRATDTQRVAYHRAFLDDVKALHEAGVTLVAGTDFPNPCVVPGASLHDELAWLVRAGLSPYEALRAATVNAARLIGAADSLGTLRPGMLADAVMLSADPRQRIGATTTTIVAVLQNGRVVYRRDQTR